ncbi:DUF1630-domain-containing protein [Aaosphaeria arxii CBS 175.79]|uniref:DUF1630-domain-containing protein n=1 Tax=Aaosphaeria arxii CBS 175.79 TaxID=1450172 RepID=A0A6A5XH41_9PLEO|nr:DUF1630-domain-containing protein [Aaosphaeria arxii CBS 175.79]KAF2012157.1 DUF1630-domain-containing protein [Aaosphaeria arxii CBS 175.79]
MTFTPAANDIFQHWAVAFVVCNFNVDIGPEVEILYPPNVAFSTQDLAAICFNSFPEQQNTETAEDMRFNFMITNNSPDISLSSPQAPHGSPTNFYGCCIFRQEFDHTMKRSFNQRTLVLISHHPFLSFYNRLLHQMTESGVISDPTTLEAAYSQILAWPSPSLGRHELPFLGTMITLDIAPHVAFPLQGLPGPLPLISDTPTSIYAYEPLGSWDSIMPFMPCITDLYILYEKLLLCEPIIVIAKSPQLCSDAISSLIDLIRPIPYAGEIKPYMTMQSEFRSIGIDGGTPRPFIIGITNPFLLKRVLSSTEDKDRVRPHILYLQNYDGPVPTRRHHSLHRKSSRNVLLDLPGGGIDAHPPARRFLKSDPHFVSQVESLLKLDVQTHALGPLIRRHFAELTAQFLAPLNRYLATSVSPTAISPGSGTFRYASFSVHGFIKDVGKHGTSVKMRGQGPMQRHRARDGLYESFCQSANFYSWLEMKTSLEREASAGLLGAGSAASSAAVPS